MQNDIEPLSFGSLLLCSSIGIVEFRLITFFWFSGRNRYRREGADAGADGGEAVAAGGGEIAEETERVEKGRFGRDDLGGCGA